MEQCQEQAGQAGAEAAAAPPNSIGRLPHELLPCVLAHVPLAQRLAAAALVCRAWATAAMAATRVISVELLSEPQVEALSAWLAANGAAAAVASLEVSAAAWSPRLSFQLPASQLSATLTSLSLRGLKVTVTASAPDDSQQQAPSSLAALTALTGLKLSACTVSLEGLPALRGLRQLELHSRYVPEGEELSAVAGQALPALAQLTRLALAGGRRDWHDAALAQLSSLAQLQELSIDSCAVTAASFAAPLPGSLTLLEVHSDFGVAFSPSTTPGLAQATALRRLSVWGASRFDLAVLQQLSELQELALSHCAELELFAPPPLPALTRLDTDRRLVRSADDVARLAAACPSLARLSVACGDNDGVLFLLNLSGLAPLPGLSRLELSRVGGDGYEQLCGLRSLSLEAPLHHIDMLNPVFQCTQLEELALELDGSSVALRNNAPAGAPPDVVQQLCSWLADTWCLPAHVDDGEAQLLDLLLRGALPAVVEQLCDSQARLRERDARLAQQGQQLQEQAQQLAQQGQQLLEQAQQLAQQGQQLQERDARLAQQDQQLQERDVQLDEQAQQLQEQAQQLAAAQARIAQLETAQQQQGRAG